MSQVSCVAVSTDTHQCIYCGPQIVNGLTTNFSDGKRLITWNGFKKTYGGPYGQYILGTVKPIQQAYFLKYQTGRINVAIGHFITSSGIPDTSINGSMSDRILNASIQVHGSAGIWDWQLHGSQFNQKYKIQHSSWGSPGSIILRGQGSREN